MTRSHTLKQDKSFFTSHFTNDQIIRILTKGLTKQDKKINCFHFPSKTFTGDCRKPVLVIDIDLTSIIDRTDTCFRRDKVTDGIKKGRLTGTGLSDNDHIKRILKCKP